MSFSNGFVIGLQSVIIPNIRESSIKLTLQQESWLPAIMILMLFPSQFISGLLTSKFGRKYVILASQIPSVFAFVLLYFSQEFWHFFIAFLLSGLVGGGLGIGPMFLAEICSPKYRGVFMNLKIGFFAIGIALVHILSNFFHWRSLIMYGLISSLLGIISTAYCPDSPSWFASKGRFDECKKTFHWFRGDSENKELKQLIECQSKDLKRKKLISMEKKLTVCKHLRERSFLLAVSLNLSCVLIVEACGKQQFMMYVFDIFSSIFSDKNNFYYYAFGLDLCDIIGGFTSCFVIHKFNRRSMLLGSGIPANILLYFICALSFCFSQDFISDKYSWVMICLFAVYFFILSCGALPTCFIIMGEVYPLEYRGVGVSISSIIFVGTMFIVTKISPFMLKYCGVSGTFLINAVISSLVLIHIYYYLPETNRKTLQDIENELKNNNNEINEDVEENIMLGNTFVSS